MKKIIIAIGFCLLMTGNLVAAPITCKVIDIRHGIENGGNLFTGYTVEAVARDGSKIVAVFGLSPTVGDYFCRMMAPLFQASTEIGAVVIWDPDKIGAGNPLADFDSGMLVDFGLITVISWGGVSTIRMF